MLGIYEIFIINCAKIALLLMFAFSLVSQLADSTCMYSYILLNYAYLHAMNKARVVQRWFLNVQPASDSREAWKDVYFYDAW